MINQFEKIDVIKFLLNQPAMKGLTESDLTEIYPFIEIRSFEPDAMVYYEDDPTHDLGIIFDGEVTLIKKSALNDEDYILGTLQKGDVIGEMAFLDSVNRFCSVKAQGDLVLIKLLHKGFTEGTIEARYIYGKIARNLGSILITRLRDANKENIRHQLLQTQENLNQEKHSRLLLKVFISLILTSGIIGLSHHLFKNETFWLRGLGVLVMLIPVFQLLRIGRFSIHDFGISSALWRNPFRKGLAFSLFSTVFLGFIFFAKNLLGYSTPLMLTTLPMAYLLLYPLYAFATEFLLRGVLQTTIARLLGSNSHWESVIYTSILIASCNLPFGMTTALLVFGLNLSCGFLYLLERNLITTTLLHIAIVLILNTQGFLIYSYLT